MAAIADISIEQLRVYQVENNSYNAFNLFQLLSCFPSGISMDTLENSFIWKDKIKLQDCLKLLEQFSLLDKEYKTKIAVSQDIIDNLAD